MGCQAARLTRYSDGVSMEPGSHSRSCRECGQALPTLDLEAEAREVDRALGLEHGRIVDRWDWAAGQPDGLFENVFAWLPGVPDRRAIWRRGQELWAERMRSEGLSHCADCRPPLPRDPA